jgi:hypothetical protein
MARVASWVATFADGRTVEMGSPKTVQELVGPYQLKVGVEGGRALVVEVGADDRAHVFTRVMRRRTGEELTVPVLELRGVRLYIHPDGDVISTSDLYW